MKLQLFIRKILLPMVIIMPIWVAIGRVFFGIGGWMVLLSVPLGFLTFIILLVMYFLTPKYPDEFGRSVVTRKSAYFYSAIYVSLFLFEIFFVDGGDTIESVNSIATKFLGVILNEQISSFLFEVFIICAGLLAVIFMVMLIIDRIKLRTAK